MVDNWMNERIAWHFHHYEKRQVTRNQESCIIASLHNVLSVSFFAFSEIKCNDHVPNMRSWGTSCGLLRSTTCTWCRTTPWCTGLPCTREEQKCSMWPDNWLQQRSAVCIDALLLSSYAFMRADQSLTCKCYLVCRMSKGLGHCRGFRSAPWHWRTTSWWPVASRENSSAR